MKKLFAKFTCWIKGHKWTSAAQKGIAPTKEQLTMEGFKDYAKMYCERCGHESILNARLKM